MAVKRSAYDHAMALCPSDSARLELSRLGAELGLGASSPEWIVVVLYAQARSLFGSGESERTALFAQEERIGQVESERAALLTQLNRIEARVEQTLRRSAKPPFPIEVRRRD